MQIFHWLMKHTWLDINLTVGSCSGSCCCGGQYWRGGNLKYCLEVLWAVGDKCLHKGIDLVESRSI